MGPANAADLDAFGTPAPPEPVPAQSPADDGIPQMYLDRGWTTWPVVADNLEGIVHQPMAERDDALARLAQPVY